VGLGVEHGLVLPLQAGLNELLDGLVHEDLPLEPKGAAIDTPLAIEQPVGHGEARVLRGIGFAGDQVVDLGQHVADVEGLQRPPAAFFVAAGIMVDFKIRGIGEVTS
jgi:hypothetical protein